MKIRSFSTVGVSGVWFFDADVMVLRDLSMVDQLVFIGLIIFFFVIKPTSCTNFTNLFRYETLHISDTSSVNHQEFIHCTLSNGIWHTSS